MNVQDTRFKAVSRDELSWLGSDPVPAAAYSDPDFFELERQAIFLREWINVGHTCELPEPGSFIRRDLEFAQTSLLIVRGKDGVIRAFHNFCTHRGTLLVPESEGRSSKFSCRYHRWTFGTDGNLLAAPDFASFNVDMADCKLKGVRVEEICGMIFVNFDKDADPLHNSLEDFPQEWSTLPVARATDFSEYSYEVNSNWKLTLDNFQEAYHIRFIHPRTGAGGCGEDNPFGYPERYRFEGPHRGMTIWAKGFGGTDFAKQEPQSQKKGIRAKAFGRHLAALADKGLLSDNTSQEFYSVFPSMLMLGNPFSNFTHAVYPISVGKTRGVIRMYWVGEAANASEQFAREIEASCMRDIQSEDVDMIEDGFFGLSSGAIEQIHFQTQESLCRHLYNQVRNRIDSHLREGVA